MKAPLPIDASPSSPNRRRTGLSLRPSQTIAIIGVLVVVTAVSLCSYFVVSLYDSEVNAIRNRLEIPAHAMAHSTEAIARNADSALRNIQATLRDADRGKLADGALHQIILYRDNISVAISRIAIYDADGVPFLNSASEAPTRGSVADYDFFRHQRAATSDELNVSGLIADPVDSKPEIILSRRIVDRSGAFAGVAAVFIDAGYLQRIFDSLQMPAGTSITAFNNEGRVVVRTPAVHLGDREIELDFSHRPIFATFRDGPRAGSFAKFQTIIGVDRFVAGVGGPNAAFVIAAGWDSRAALASWRSDSLAITTSTAVALLGALALLVYLRRQIGRNEALLSKVSEAELRQRNLMIAIPDAVAIVGESLMIEFANPAAERLYGYGPGELNGVALSALMADSEKDDGFDTARFWVDGSSNTDSTSLQRTAKSKDGTEFPVEISICRYRASDGPKLISVTRDVTVREAKDLALRRNRESLARAQAMAALGSFDRDLLTGVIECSDEFLRIWGFPPDITHPTPETLFARLHPDDRVGFVACREAVLAGEAMPKFEFRIIRPDGEERILHHEYNADFDADGKPTRLFGIIQDITERTNVETVLRRSRENLARAQRVAAIGSFDRDLVTGRTEWSEEFLKIWGVQEGPPLDGSAYLAQLVHPDDRAKFLAGREAAIRDEPVPPLDFRITRPDGELRFLHREFGVIFNEQGRAVRLFGTIQDVTERKRIETELRQSREDLARAQQIAQIGSFSRELSTGKIEWSDAFLRIWGITETETLLSAETLATMVHPADRPVLHAGTRCGSA